METGNKNDYYLELQRQFNRAKTDLGALFLFSGVANERGDFIAFMEGLTPTCVPVIELGGFIPAESGIFPPEFLSAQRGLAAATGIMPSGVDENYVIAAYAPIFDRAGVPIGLVGINILASEILQNSNYFASVITMTVAVIIVIVIWLSIFWIKKYIGNPINELKNAAQQISQGNLIVTFSTERNDEIGVLAQSFDSMRKVI